MDATRRSRLLMTAGAGGLALALGAGGVALAADDNNDDRAANRSSAARDAAPGDAPLPPLRPGAEVGGPMGALHGEFVVPDRDGSGYRTVRMQRGTVESVGATSIELKSEDGYTKTYTVSEDTIVNAQRDGIATIDKGDTVSLSAVVDGDTATAQHITDLTQLEKGGGPRFRHGPMMRQRMRARSF